MALDPTVQNTSAPIVPAQPAPPAVNDTSAPADTGVPGESPSLPAKPIVPPPQAPAPKPNQTMPGNEHATMIGKIFQTIAGGKTTDYANTPEGPVPVKRNLAPGEMARNILGAAFSLLAAGTGGAQAGLQGRQYKQPEDQTIGGIEKGRIQTRERQAQQVFNNKQVADEATLRAHKDAMEQQRSIQEAKIGEQQIALNTQKLAEGDRTALNDAYEQNLKYQKDYDSAMAMPGASVVKDNTDNEENFLTLNEARDYVNKHPEIIHGSTNGNSKYGVVIKLNPSTLLWQIIDYPAERHDPIVTNYGQKVDKNGNPVFDKDGNPVPNGIVIDPKTHKPTVITQPITPDQARAIASQNLKDSDVEAQMADREAQARQRDAAAAKDQNLQDAIDLYNGGKFDKMTDRQKALVARMTFQEQTLLSNRENKAAANLAKVSQFSDHPTTDPQVIQAQKEYNDAKDDYEDSAEKYGQLTGNTMGIQVANKIIRTTNLGPIKTKADWEPIDKQITDAVSDPRELEKARNKVWSALTPAQQAAITGAAPTPINVPAGATTTMMGHDGKRHFTNAQGTVDLGIVPNQ